MKPDQAVAFQWPEHPLSIAVVGHTNTGKTSLLRTLTRNPEFGHVGDRPGTTRQVEGIQLLVEAHPVIEFFDTPGIEDAIGLSDYLEQICAGKGRMDGPDRIECFLNATESGRRFEQEARVLRKLLDCHAALYVIDARDPVLSKHREELAILAYGGHPLLPVLNFVNDKHQRVTEWREALSRLNLHALVEFDTIAPPLDGEDQLYDRLGVLLDTRKPLFDHLKANLQEQKQHRRGLAVRLVADLLIDSAALRVSTPPKEPELAQATEQIRQMTRDREQQCVQALLELFNFRRDDFPQHELTLEGEQWSADLFNPHTLREAGIEVTKGAAAGAAAGFAVDVLSAGLSLGSGTLIGAAVGGAWQTFERYGKSWWGRVRGFRELRVDDDVLRLLAAREMALIEALERRGHAALEPVSINVDRITAFAASSLPEAIQEARANPQWSTASPQFEDSVRRQRRLDELYVLLQA
jgi:hypothetical protein